MDRTARLLASCTHMGSARLTLRSVGPFTLPVGDLLDTPVTLQHGGKNGRRHTLACPPTTGHGKVVPGELVTAVPATLGDVQRVPPSFRHGCVESVVDLLPEYAVVELSMLHDAELLLAPWLEARLEEARYGRPFLPPDSTPVHSGLLARVARDMLEYAAERPDRTHMGLAGQQALEMHRTWATRHADWPAIQAADPHQKILAWQRSEVYAELQGSAKQVRAAEEIRFDLVTSGVAGAREIAIREMRAGVWFALAREEVDVYAAWQHMRDPRFDVRAIERGEASLWDLTGRPRPWR